MEKINFAALREKMCRFQLRKRGINDEKLLEAFKNIPREEFVPSNYRNSAYEDFPLPIGLGQTISQPYMTALMLQLLDVKKEEKILEIGTGSGYQTALLAFLGADIYSIERLGQLANLAKKKLDKLHLEAKIKIGDGTLGWEEFSPYDKIIVSASSFKIPEPLIKQLRIGGKLLMPLGGILHQDLTLIEKTDEKNSFKTKSFGSCIFVPLVGKYGYQK